MHLQHPELLLGAEELQPLSPHSPLSNWSSPNSDDSSLSQSGDNTMPGPVRAHSGSPSRISGEDDASQGDVKMRFDLPLNLFDGGNNNGGHNNDGEKTSSPH